MLVVKDHRDFQLRYSRCVATIGKFDGVHQGHQAILGQLRGKAAQLELPALVILIEPHPEEFFAPTPEQCPARLNTLDEKLALLEAMDIDFVYLLKFDAALSQLSAADYIRDILVDGLGIAAFIVGNDFRYGYQRRGDFQLLQEAGGKFGFEVIETATCVVEGHRVSSTYVRQQLEAANFPLVERLLGRPYSISGEVVEGRKLGADLGFPTCNVNLHRQRVPLHGVYACEVDVDGRSYPAAVNIGYRPTVTDLGEALLEAHLLDFSGDLYGRTLEVIFRGKVRGEEKFDSLEALIRQIARDVEQVRAFFAAET
ncbi:MAG: bifunctional riboflavin kinase/FAD synthetase [Gammaproteobacteria bacterium]|nr:bifunctional riboflavin kinase/FAD synthetase [Pseudomonadales bacterium]MCP5346711.1 bifunctional riboflavin kinase/FAD synthetase [Pseudomonadales bacterium]